MFDINEAYNGAMVQAEGAVANGAEFKHGGESLAPAPQTAEEILQYAREEAAEILENAQLQAQEYLAQQQTEAHEQASRIVAENVNESLANLGPELYSAKAGISKIVQNSIELMIGAIGSEKAFAMAVEKATRDYIKANKLTLHAHPDSANRLKLYKMSQPKNKLVSNYEIVEDTNLEPGRCILDTGDKRVEVSLEIQINALKQCLDNSLSGGKG
jgi:flagellar biosynthesis/type III secretory pathway protein FliH